MDFKKLQEYKPHTLFYITEKDLSQDSVYQRKTFFTDDDTKIAFSNESLSNGTLEIPIFKETIIRPIGFNSKYLNYEIESKGAGFYVITYKRGQAIPKPNDHQHLHELVEKTTFYIAYDRQEKRYKYLEKEKKFLQLYQEIEELKNSDEIQTLINDFVNWITSFWSAEYKSKHNLGTSTANLTYQEYKDIVDDIDNAIPLLENYHLLLNIFGDIADLSYQYILNSINELKTYNQNAREHLEKYYPDLSQKVDYNEERGYDKPLTDLQIYLTTELFERNYYIDKETQTAHPNIYEVFIGKQLTTEFESDNGKKDRLKQLIKANSAKGKFKYTIKD